ncbi:hypothetical protein [Leptospira noguchii]|nr:hypothetical protein [Leptospira noguchii]
MLRSIVSSIEFEKFRRNWSEKRTTQRLASRVARETQNVAACCRNVRS